MFNWLFGWIEKRVRGEQARPFTVAPMTDVERIRTAMEEQEGLRADSGAKAIKDAQARMREFTEGLQREVTAAVKTAQFLSPLGTPLEARKRPFEAELKVLQGKMDDVVKMRESALKTMSTMPDDLGAQETLRLTTDLLGEMTGRLGGLQHQVDLTESAWDRMTDAAKRYDDQQRDLLRTSLEATEGLEQIRQDLQQVGAAPITKNILDEVNQSAALMTRLQAQRRALMLDPAQFRETIPQIDEMLAQIPVATRQRTEGLWKAHEQALPQTQALRELQTQVGLMGELATVQGLARQERLAETQVLESVARSKQQDISLTDAQITQLRTWTLASVDARDQLENARRPLLEFADDGKSAFLEMQESLVGSFRGLEEALVNFAQKGKTTFRELATSILQEMGRVALRRTVTQPLAQGLDFLLDTAVRAIVAAATGGGPTQAIVPSAATTGVGALGGIFPGHFEPLYAFAGGGLVGRPTFGIIGEAGPEAVVPLSGRRDIPVRFEGSRDWAAPVPQFKIMVHVDGGIIPRLPTMTREQVIQVWVEDYSHGGRTRDTVQGDRG